MGPLFGILGMIASLVGFVCFILVIVKIFQNGKTGLGIGLIVGLFCFGIGYLITFVYGWMQSSTWNIKNIMLIWTVCFVIGILNMVINGLPAIQMQAG